MGWRDLTRNVINAVKSVMGESVTYIPQGDDDEAYSITGVFDEAYELVDLAAGADVSSVHPMLLVKIDDMETEPARGDELEVRDVRYVVIESQTDGQAAFKLILHKKEIA